MEWYYGAVDRNLSEEILRKCTYNAFLVRDSATVKGSFVASIWNPQLNSMFHCLVSKQMKHGIQSYSFDGIEGGTGFKIVRCDISEYKNIVDLILNSPLLKAYGPAIKQRSQKDPYFSGQFVLDEVVKSQKKLNDLVEISEKQMMKEFEKSKSFDFLPSGKNHFKSKTDLQLPQ
jgi:hypothetical protein